MRRTPGRHLRYLCLCISSHCLSTHRSPPAPTHDHPNTTTTNPATTWCCYSQPRECRRCMTRSGWIGRRVARCWLLNAVLDVVKRALPRWLLPVAGCLLPIAYCLLPIACCILHQLCCMRRTPGRHLRYLCLCLSSHYLSTHRPPPTPTHEHPNTTTTTPATTWCCCSQPRGCRRCSWWGCSCCVWSGEGLCCCYHLL
jgi:hypothetical protein